MADQDHTETPSSEDSYKQRYSRLLNLLVSGGTPKIGDEPLVHIACKRGDTELVRALISNGDDSIDTVHASETLLYVACWFRHYDIVELLLNAGVSVDVGRLSPKTTPLYISCQQGFYDIAKLLLDKGANIDAVYLGSFSPLHIACKNGHLAITELLLHRGARINEKPGSLLKVIAENQLSWPSKIRMLRLLLSADARFETLEPLKRFPDGCPVEFILVAQYYPMVLLHQQLRQSLLGKQVRLKPPTIRALASASSTSLIFGVVKAFVGQNVNWDLQMMVLKKVVRVDLRR